MKKRKKKRIKARLPIEMALRLHDGGAHSGKKGAKGYSRKGYQIDRDFSPAETTKSTD